jgi:hypothetical protein
VSPPAAGVLLLGVDLDFDLGRLGLRIELDHVGLVQRIVRVDLRPDELAGAEDLDPAIDGLVLTDVELERRSLDRGAGNGRDDE